MHGKSFLVTEKNSFYTVRYVIFIFLYVDALNRLQHKMNPSLYCMNFTFVIKVSSLDFSLHACILLR